MSTLMIIGSKIDVRVFSTATVSHVGYDNHMLNVTGDHVSSSYYSLRTHVPS